ncbi:MAG: N-acetylmuramoyl-L-alanine amidase [Phycisphaerae bacterium]|nr:N-acetylmuramoyl-L-alanine amidase [Phycisphaerae bacterium]
MLYRIFALLVLFLPLVASVGGCEQNNVRTANFPVTADDEPLRATELARTLDMKVDRAGRGMTRLSDARNVVLLFPAAGGAYVNGKSVGTPDDVMVFGGETYVTRRLVKTLRARLLPASPRPAPQPVAPPAPIAAKSLGTVLLDAGHGGEDPGAIARTGLREKDVVLPVTLELARRLQERGATVKLTRSSDVFVTLDGRVEQANRVRPDLFLSIHADASPNRSVRGATVYVPRREGTSSRSYQAGRAIVGALGAVSSGGRGMRTHEKNLRVLERTTCPAVLVELGFLTNGNEEQLLASSYYQRRLAEALCQAVVQYLRQ